MPTLQKKTGETPSNVTVELTKEDAALFLEYRKHHDRFAVLHNSGVFGIVNGNAIVSFDIAGEIVAVDIKMARYRKGKAILVHTFTVDGGHKMI